MNLKLVLLYVTVENKNDYVIINGVITLTFTCSYLVGVGHILSFYVFFVCNGNLLEFYLTFYKNMSHTRIMTLLFYYIPTFEKVAGSYKFCFVSLFASSIVLYSVRQT